MTVDDRFLYLSSFRRKVVAPIEEVIAVVEFDEGDSPAIKLELRGTTEVGTDITFASYSLPEEIMCTFPHLVSAETRTEE